jgi:hypothetical protein
MEPQRVTKNFEQAPAPMAEVGRTPVDSQPNQVKSPEAAKRAEFLTVSHSGSQPTVAMPAQQDDLSSTAQPAGTAAQAGPLADDRPAVAGDSDTIEKEWVNKVNRIVDANGDDPYTQQKLLSELMIDYIAKRYNRKIGQEN